MIKIIKNREGEIIDFNKEKISNAITLAANSVGFAISNESKETVINLTIDILVKKLNGHADTQVLTVNDIQDAVEEALMRSNLPKVAKEYILYRNKKDELRKANQEMNEEKIEKHSLRVTKSNGETEIYQEEKIKRVFERVSYGLKVSYEDFKEELKKYLVDGIKTEDLFKMMVKSSIDLISTTNVDYQILAGRLNILDMYKQASKNRGMKMESIYDGKEFLKLMKDYIADGLYFKDFLNPEKGGYTEEEVLELANLLNRDFDMQLTYQSTLMLRKRYLLQRNKKVLKELPQEMYLANAMFLALPEKENKVDIAKKFYEITASQKLSLPTPTLLNARTNYHQLSSCFKLNVGDDLRSIYHSIENMAQISKFGGGIGVYLGHIRAKGASIRGFKGLAGGVNPWIKVINDTAVSVNQLGARAGAISVTLDAFHAGIFDFLDLQTETGDIRGKSFDIFPAVSFPDLFFERLERNESWSIFDPKEIFDLYGKRLENTWGEEFNEFYSILEKDDRLELKETVNAKELFKKYLKTVVETGMPYAFFRDEANRKNPNKHAGMIYSTQLCVEIQQNTSEPIFVEETFEDGKIRIEYAPGESVVCNLASINVARVNKKEEISEVVPLAMRLLDNVITLNYYPIKESELTSKKYRSVGLGFLGLSEYLAVNKIAYDSEKGIEETKKLFDLYSYYAIKGSNELSAERGAYQLFEGSDWSKGIFFGKKLNWFEENTKSDLNWKQLFNDVKSKGLRNAYLMAPAPNTSTSIIVGTTAGVLPIYKKYFVETNAVAPSVNVAPGLNEDNFWFYKEYVNMEQGKVIDMMTDAIQPYIDQSISFEWIINPQKTSPAQLFELYLKAWKQKIKTIYYVRSMSLEIEKCESCAG